MKIKEDFCSVEITELLKAKGADLETWALLPKHNPDGTSQMVEVPTHQAAMKWLREEHDIHIEVIRGYDHFFVGIAKMHPFREYAMKNDIFDVYEEAVEAALKYALENLI